MIVIVILIVIVIVIISKLISLMKKGIKMILLVTGYFSKLLKIS